MCRLLWILMDLVVEDPAMNNNWEKLLINSVVGVAKRWVAGMLGIVHEEISIKISIQKRNEKTKHSMWMTTWVWLCYKSCISIGIITGMKMSMMVDYLSSQTHKPFVISYSCRSCCSTFLSFFLSSTLSLYLSLSSPRISYCEKYFYDIFVDSSRRKNPTFSWCEKIEMFGNRNQFYGFFLQVFLSFFRHGGSFCCLS